MIPPQSTQAPFPEAPKDGKTYGRKDGRRENIHTIEIDGGFADSEQLYIID
jgi:hypothetical protein